MFFNFAFNFTDDYLNKLCASFRKYFESIDFMRVRFNQWSDGDKNCGKKFFHNNVNLTEQYLFLTKCTIILSKQKALAD